MKRIILYFLVGYAVLAFLVSCSSLTSGSSSSTNTYPVISPADLPKTEEIDIAYPVASELSPTPSENNLSIRTPENTPGFGVVYGQLNSKTENKPLSDVKIYLAEKVQINQSESYVLAVQEKGSPQSLTDVNGRFIIEAIPPANYVLFFITPYGNYTVLDSKDTEIHLTIESDDLLDVGRVFVNWP